MNGYYMDKQEELNEALDSALQTNQAMGKKLQQQQALIEVLANRLGELLEMVEGDGQQIGMLDATDGYYQFSITSANVRRLSRKALQSAKAAGCL